MHPKDTAIPLIKTTLIQIYTCSPFQLCPVCIQAITVRPSVLKSLRHTHQVKNRRGQSLHVRKDENTRTDSLPWIALCGQQPHKSLPGQRWTKKQSSLKITNVCCAKRTINTRQKILHPLSLHLTNEKQK